MELLVSKISEVDLGLESMNDMNALVAKRIESADMKLDHLVSGTEGNERRSKRSEVKINLILRMLDSVQEMMLDMVPSSPTENKVA